MNNFDLIGRTAIVTGCQRGIGLGIAIEVAQAGVEVVILGIVDDEGERVTASCAQLLWSGQRGT